MYYIYELWNTETKEPIYVGYAKHDRQSCRPRHEDHIHEAIKYKNSNCESKKNLNMYKIHVLLQLIEKNVEIEYKFPYTQISYDEACEREKELISLYGRRLLGTGTLTNIDAGGQGGRELTEETKKKISDALKGRESHLKGKSVGPYGNDRKLAIKKGIEQFNNSNRGKQVRKIAGQNQKGKTAWNKGKTKDTCASVAKYVESKKGTSRPDMIGNVPWNKGKTKEDDNRLKQISESKKGSVPWNKGKTLETKNKSYEEIYGYEKAQQMKEARKNTAWINNGSENKKINLSDINSWLETGWVRGRLIPKRKNK